MKTDDNVIKPGKSYSQTLSQFPELVMVTAVSKCACKLSQDAEKGELFGPKTVPMNSTVLQETRTALSYDSGRPSRYFDSAEKAIMKEVKEKENGRIHVPVIRERIIRDDVSNNSDVL